MITIESNIAFLRKYYAWRMDDSRKPRPVDVGENIDFAIQQLLKHKIAIKTLNQIATMPRKTREQRLASSCVAFLESLP